MKNPKKLIIYVLRASLIAITAYLIYQKDFLFAFSAFIASIISFLPILIKKNYQFTLPWKIEFMIAVVLLLHILGELFILFDRVFFYSPMMHFLGTFTIALLAFIIIYSLNLTKHVKLSIFMIGFFTLMFAMSIGAFWEIGEFASDKTFGTHAQGDGIDPLDDTMYDLTWDAAAGLVIAIIGSSLMKRHHELVHPFEEYLKKSRHKKHRPKLKKRFYKK